MDKLAPFIFAILLFIGGGAIIGKAFLGRPGSNAPAAVAACPSLIEIKLNDEVRAYIDQELQFAVPAKNDDVTPQAFLDTISNLEKRADGALKGRSKPKQFMDRLINYSKDMLAWDNSHEDRIAKERILYGLDIMNDAVAKCGVKRPAPPKTSLKPAQANPGTPPPQPAPPK